MSIFNLKKKAQDLGYKNINNLLKDENNKTDIGTIESPGNINLIMPTKNLDNLEINEKQLNSNREGKDSLIITEKSLNNSPKVYNDKRLDETGDIMPINLLSQSLDEKHLEVYKKGEGNIKDTIYWDKHVGVELDKNKTMVGTNIEKNQQLGNNPNRFKELGNKNETVKDVATFNVKKIASSIKDADALLFHIYANAFKKNRDLITQEKQMIDKINNEKMEILSNMDSPIYAPEDKIRIVKQGNKYVAYDGLGQEKWRTEDENEILRHYPDAAREY